MVYPPPLPPPRHPTPPGLADEGIRVAVVAGSQLNGNMNVDLDASFHPKTPLQGHQAASLVPQNTTTGCVVALIISQLDIWVQESARRINNRFCIVCQWLHHPVYIMTC